MQVGGKVHSFSGKLYVVLPFIVVSAVHAVDGAPELPKYPIANTGVPAVQNQPVMIPGFKEVEMERLRLLEENGKAEQEEADFQKQIATLQKKLADASAFAVLPKSMPSDYRAFLSASGSDIARSQEYYASLKKLLNLLVPDSPYRARTVDDSSNPMDGADSLLKLSEYPDDDDVCRSIRGHIAALTGGRIDDNRRQAQLANEIASLNAERKRLEWNLMMTQKPNPLTGDTATEDERDYIRQQISKVKSDIAEREDERNSLSQRVTAETRKLQFQQFIVELAVQQRYIHALIACGFYRNSFKGADLAISDKAYPARKRSETEATPNVGTPAELPSISTITGMEAFLLNRIKDSVKDREAVDNMIRENQIGAAESLIRKMLLTAKYQPELQTIPYADRQRILAGGESLKRISDAINARDYEAINKFVSEMEAKGADTGLEDLRAFAAEHPRKAMHWARQAELALKMGETRTAVSLMEFAVRRAPLDKSVSEKIESIQADAARNKRLFDEFERIVESNDYRAAAERLPEFASFMGKDTPNPELQKKFEALVEQEKSLRRVLEISDSLEQKKASPQAWMELERLTGAGAADPRVAERKARLAGQCPTFVKAYSNAVANEKNGYPNKALAWYLKALSETPGDETLAVKIRSIGTPLVEN